MTGAEFREIRLGLGLTQTGFGRVLGYGGKDGTMQKHVSQLESGARPVPEAVGRLAAMLGRYGVPEDFFEI